MKKEDFLLKLEELINQGNNFTNQITKKYYTIGASQFAPSRKTMAGYNISDNESYETWKTTSSLLLNMNGYNDNCSEFIKKTISPENHFKMLAALKSIYDLETINTECILDDRIVINSNIFIVHGHDEQMKDSVELFIRQKFLNPIILNQQANTGKTIVEKFEDHSDVGYAIVLFSPCDEGKAINDKDLKKRARQNVIFELGFFMGKLSRSRVCVLLKSDVEKPSDIDGVLYIFFDEESRWKESLLKELQTTGYDVN
jgi:predicted nucleotide-binding protein